MDTNGRRPGPATPGQTRWRRRGAVSALLVLAAITAVISYQHAYAVVREVGNTALLAILIPFVPDLTVLTAYLVLLDAAHTGVRKPPLAYVGLWGGIGATVAMNVAAGLPHHLPGALVAGAGPLALVLAFHLLIGRGSKQGPAGPGEATAYQCPHGQASTADDVVRLVHDHARECLGEPISARRLAAITVPSRNRVAEVVRQSVNGHQPDSTREASDE